MHPKSMGTEAPAVGTLLALIQCLPVKDRKNNVDGCSTTSCNFGALTGEKEHASFYSAFLNWKALFSYKH